MHGPQGTVGSGLADRLLLPPAGRVECSSTAAYGTGAESRTVGPAEGSQAMAQSLVP